MYRSIGGFWLAILSLFLSALVYDAFAQKVEVDSSIPSYQKVSGVSGNINSIGSDTMNNLMTLWCEGFNKYYPNVKCQIEGKGSSTAPPALIEGSSLFGPMSRKMKATELREAVEN